MILPIRPNWQLFPAKDTSHPPVFHTLFYFSKTAVLPLRVLHLIAKNPFRHTIPVQPHIRKQANPSVYLDQIISFHLCIKSHCFLLSLSFDFSSSKLPCFLHPIRIPIPPLPTSECRNDASFNFSSVVMK